MLLKHKILHSALFQKTNDIIICLYIRQCTLALFIKRFSIDTCPSLKSYESTQQKNDKNSTHSHHSFELTLNIYPRWRSQTIYSLRQLPLCKYLTKNIDSIHMRYKAVSLNREICCMTYYGTHMT